MVRTHVIALAQALFVTFLWSTSWVLIKVGLEAIPALTFAGLIYTLAFILLLPWALRHGTVQRLTAQQWRSLALLGLVFYTLTQGAQFLALAYLPAQATSLVLSFSPAAVGLLAAWTLGEGVGFRRILGIVLYLLGVLLYFYPLGFPQAQIVGYALAAIAMVANAVGSVLGRSINRDGTLSPLTVTVVSMGVGSVALLVTGLSVQGLPTLSLSSWAIIIWLAVVNTAWAFTLWNHTLRTLTALESSLVNNTMLIQIALLA
jgi:drug/metabolite transporter (DMT)-like permease